MSPAEKVRATFAFTVVALKATYRDRVALFFMFALPIAVIIVVGTTFGSLTKVRLGIVDEANDTMSARIVAAFEQGDGFEVKRFGSLDDLRKAVRRGASDIGVVMPAGLDASVQAGQTVKLPQVQLAASDSAVVASTAVSGVISKLNALVGAAQFASSKTNTPFATALTTAKAVSASTDSGGTVVTVVDVGDRLSSSASKFSLTVPQQLVLFTFVNALASAAFIVVARREGVMRRSLAAPVSASLLVTGIGFAWFAIALIQSAFIVSLGALLFGVDWGNPIAALALVIAFAALSCGGGLVVGAYGQNEDKVAAITTVVGIVLAAIGGCMVPLDVFPGFMRTLAHVTPHYWAISAWEKLVFDGESIGAIAGSLAVLVAGAVVLTVIAARKLRHDLTFG